MQGFLYKKSGKPLSREWKKKYVTLMDDGHLIYYPSYNVGIVACFIHSCFVDLTERHMSVAVYSPTVSVNETQSA